MGLALSALASAYVGPKAKAGLTPRNTTTTLPELSSSVTIEWDSNGVPHIRGKTALDVITAQGWVHASDRLWQMETLRCVAFGTLSELIGPAGLIVDRTSRTWGWGVLANGDISHLRRKAESGNEAAVASLALLEGYVRGVNAFIDALPFGEKGVGAPMEYAVMGIRPKRWSLEQVAGITRILSAQLGFGFFHKMCCAVLSAEVGAEMAKEIEPWEGDAKFSLEHPENVDLESVMAALGGAEAFRSDKGSNAWVLSGDYTESGKPLLANDPHLGFSTPSFWFFNHIEAEEPWRGRPFRGIGSSVPGMPAIVVGSNDRISWGVTVAIIDVEDAVMIKTDPTDPDRYIGSDGSPRPFVHTFSDIHVKGQAEPERHEVISTEHGPLIKSHVKTMEHTPEFALRSANLQPHNESLIGVFALCSSDSWESFRSACSHFLCPTLNLLYADVDGNIGYQVIGRIPNRPKPFVSTAYPVPGWTKEHEWIGMIPWEEMPYEFNPPSGRIVSTNDDISGPKYKYRTTLGHVFQGANRGVRIRELLDAIPKGKHNSANSHAIQLDWLSVAARNFIQETLKPIRANGPVLPALRSWDFVMSPDSSEALIWKFFTSSLQRLIIEPVVGSQWLRTIDGNGWHSVITPISAWKNLDVEILSRILSNPGSGWLAHFDGSPQKAVDAAAEDAWMKLTEAFGSDPSKWKYGAFRTFQSPHAFGARPALGRVLNIPTSPVPIGGDGTTVWPSGTGPVDAAGPATAGPVFRWLRDLSSHSRSQFVMVTGNSGQYLSPNYDDHYRAWLAGELKTLEFSPLPLCEPTSTTTLRAASHPGLSIVGWKSYDGRIAYEVSKGTGKGFVYRFYTDFSVFAARLPSNSVKMLPPFPARGWWRDQGEAAEARAKARMPVLNAWLALAARHYGKEVDDWLLQVSK